jgi:hypothetical protein
LLLITGLLLFFFYGRRDSAARPEVATPASATPADVSGFTSDQRTRLRSAKDARRAVLLQKIRMQAANRLGGASGSERGPAEGSSSGRQGSAAASASGSDPTSDEDAADQEYVTSTMQSLVPDVMACYRQGLQRVPGLAGVVVVKFTVEGEPEVGGVITENSIDTTASDLPDEAVRECIADAMYGLEIEPPAKGGVVHIEFPFTFAPPEH